MSAVQKKLNNLVFFYVFFPAFLLLAWLNYDHYRSLQEEAVRNLDGVINDVTSAVEVELRTAGDLALSFSSAPQVLDLLLKKSPGLKNYASARPVSTASVPALEEQVAQRFRALQQEHPEIQDFLLVDNLGSPMAQLGTSPAESGQEEWFKRVIRENLDLPYYLGMHAQGSLKADTFSVVVGVLDKASTPAAAVGAVICTVSLERLMDRVKSLALREGHTAAVLVPYKWHILGADNIGASDAEAAIGAFRQLRAPPPQGVWNGITFRWRDISKAFELTSPPRVLALYRGSLLAGGGAASILILGVGSVLGLLLVTGLAQGRVRRIQRETVELTESGTWLLHQMRGEAKVPSANLSTLMRHPLYDEILRWQAGYKQSIADDIETYAFENKRDLFLARDFQLAYMNRPFPAIPAMPLPGRLRLRFAHRYKPALAIGGDFFDVMNLTPETGGIFIADVMGHGTRSALITSILRVIIADTRPQGGNARNFLREMNRKFHDILASIEMDIPLFASAFYLVTDCTARVATYSTAGHPAPFLLRRQSNTLESLKVAEPHGAALGISQDEDYTGGSCRLQGGDVFIFYTDGVYECFNPRGEEFGIINLEKTIRRLMHRSAEEILQGIIDALEDYSGGTILHDDICLLAVEIEEDLPTLNHAGATPRGSQA